MYPEKLLILFNFGIKAFSWGGITKEVCLPHQKTFKEIKYLLYFLQMFPYNSHNLFVKRDEEMD